MSNKQQSRIDREWRYGIMLFATLVAIAAAQVIVETSMPSVTMEDKLAVSPLVGAAGGFTLIASMIILGEVRDDE